MVDWSVEETIRSREGHRFAVDAFGYDSGIRPHNVGTAIEYLMGGIDPSTEARVHAEGMDRIPGALAERFRARGGEIRLGHDLRQLTMEGGRARLRFVDGRLHRRPPHPADRGPGRWRLERRACAACPVEATLKQLRAIHSAVEVLEPRPSVSIYISGESFSRAQAWIEGALETAELVAELLCKIPGVGRPLHSSPPTTYLI